MKPARNRPRFRRPIRAAGPGMRLARRAPSRPPRKRRWPAVLGILVLLFGLWMLWPAPQPPDLPAPKVDPKPAEPPLARVVSPAPPRRPKPPEPSQASRARRDLLLAAIRARAASLRPCVPGDAAELRVPVRLFVLRSGPVKAVEFPGEPPKRELRDCVRRVATAWSFQDVELPSDVELFATLALGPGA